MLTRTFIAAIVKNIPGEDKPQIINLYSSLLIAEKDFLEHYNGLFGYRVTQLVIVR